MCYYHIKNSSFFLKESCQLSIKTEQTSIMSKCNGLHDHKFKQCPDVNLSFHVLLKVVASWHCLSITQMTSQFCTFLILIILIMNSSAIKPWQETVTNMLTYHRWTFFSKTHVGRLSDFLSMKHYNSNWSCLSYLNFMIFTFFYPLF